MFHVKHYRFRPTSLRFDVFPCVSRETFFSGRHILTSRLRYRYDYLYRVFFFVFYARGYDSRAFHRFDRFVNRVAKYSDVFYIIFGFPRGMLLFVRFFLTAYPFAVYFALVDVKSHFYYLFKSGKTLFGIFYAKCRACMTLCEAVFGYKLAFLRRKL